MNHNSKHSRSGCVRLHRGGRLQRHRTILSIFGFVVAPLLVFITLLAGASPLQRQDQDIQSNAKKEVNANQIHIVDYDEAKTIDQPEHSKRRIRGSKFDKSLWNVDPEDISDTTVRVDFVDPNLPAFPFLQSTAVLIGQVGSARTYLSNDRTGVYTEFIVDVEDVLKSDMQGSLPVGSTIEIIREGGSVRFPSGKVHRYKSSGEEMPRVGARYVIFLTGSNLEHGVQILTAYELRSGQIFPLDNLPNPQRYKNANETAFLNELRIKAANNARSPQ